MLNDHKKNLTKRQKIVGITLVSILTLLAVIGISAKIGDTTDDIYSKFSVADSTSGVGDDNESSDLLSDEEYAKWFDESLGELTPTVQQLTDAQDSYYEGDERWESEYREATAKLQDMFEDSCENIPDDPDLQSLHTEYSNGLMRLAEGGLSVLATDGLDEESTDESFQKQRYIAKQQLTPILQEIVDFIQDEGL